MMQKSKLNKTETITNKRKETIFKIQGFIFFQRQMTTNLRPFFVRQNQYTSPNVKVHVSTVFSSNHNMLYRH